MLTDSLHPGFSIDCVVFGYHQRSLQVLLLKLKLMDAWALPGGFLERHRDVDDEAVRILRERTGLDKIFLQQFHLFGAVTRNSTDHVVSLLEKGVIDQALGSWFKQRFLTLGYYALVDFTEIRQMTPDPISEFCSFYTLNELPPLFLDHKEIIEKAHKTLKSALNYEPIGMNLLPAHFTMPELQGLYETILEKKLDRRNFARRIKNYDIIKPAVLKKGDNQNKNPRLYEFDKEKYHTALELGFHSGW
jgi:ADP-ribose pyrophosphatase YjhB (NUDIX family)